MMINHYLRVVRININCLDQCLALLSTVSLMPRAKCLPMLNHSAHPGNNMFTKTLGSAGPDPSVYSTPLIRSTASFWALANIKNS